jgi:hypothetical protein
MDINAIPHQSIWLISVLLTIFFGVLNSIKKRKTKALILETESRKEILKEKSVAVINQEIIEKTAITFEKKESGELTLELLKEQLRDTSNQLKFIDVGLVPPTFKFDDSEALKEKIETVRKEQFQVIVCGDATSSYSNWEWYGSKSKGKEMVDAYQSLLLKAFNAEFDMLRKKMRHSTYDATYAKLDKLEDQLIKLGETANARISRQYFRLKSDELGLWHKELEDKEDLKQIRKEEQAILREQAKQSSGDDADDIEDELFYSKADLEKAKKLALKLHGPSAAEMKLKINGMQKEIKKLETKFERAISQAQLTKAGYIYVISNIGSFGEGVVKIGMTRRLEPMDRVKELGDASVPYKFDVHTLSFVDNAPSIEKALHRKFTNNRVNIENHRKEFFRVSPEEVASAMEAMGIESDWYFEIEAKEYRESLLIREALFNETAKSSKASKQLPDSI